MPLPLLLQQQLPITIGRRKSGAQDKGVKGKGVGKSRGTLYRKKKVQGDISSASSVPAHTPALQMQSSPFPQACFAAAAHICIHQAVLLGT